MEINFGSDSKIYNAKDPVFSRPEEVREFKGIKDKIKVVNEQVEDIFKFDCRQSLDLNPTINKVALDTHIDDPPFYGAQVTGFANKNKNSSEIDAKYTINSKNKIQEVAYELKDQTEKIIVENFRNQTVDKITYNRANGTITYEQTDL